MYLNVEALMADRNVSDEKARETALCLADACKANQMSCAEDLIGIIQRHRPDLVRIVADRLLSPRSRQRKQGLRHLAMRQHQSAFLFPQNTPIDKMNIAML